MNAASAVFSRFPSIPVEALADLDAVLDWSAKPMGQRTLSSILTAELNDAAGKAAAAAPASPSGPLAAAAATTSGGTSGNTSSAMGPPPAERGVRGVKKSASEDVDTPSDSEEEEEDEPSDDGEGGGATRRRRPRRCTRFGTGGQPPKPAEKRRVGRPIEYYGDADAPNLTPAERRRIRRRIANRESARRVRSRRLGELEEAQKMVATLQENCAQLRNHTVASEAQCASLETEAGEMDSRWRAAAAETSRLRSELGRLRSMFQVYTGTAALKHAVAAEASVSAASRPDVVMEVALTADLSEALVAPLHCSGGAGAPRVQVLEGSDPALGPAGAARAGSEMLLDTQMCGADGAMGASYGGFLVCA